MDLIRVLTLALPARQLLLRNLTPGAIISLCSHNKNLRKLLKNDYELWIGLLKRDTIYYYKPIDFDPKMAFVKYLEWYKLYQKYKRDIDNKYYYCLYRPTGDNQALISLMENYTYYKLMADGDDKYVLLARLIINSVSDNNNEILDWILYELNNTISYFKNEVIGHVITSGASGESVRKWLLRHNLKITNNNQLRDVLDSLCHYFSYRDYRDSQSAYAILWLVDNHEIDEASLELYENCIRRVRAGDYN